MVRKGGKRAREETEGDSESSHACPLCLSALESPVVLHSVMQGNSENVCLCCSVCANDWRLLQSTARTAPCPQCETAVPFDGEGAAFPPFSGVSRNGRTTPIIVNAVLNLRADVPETVCGFCEDAEGTVECANCCFPLCEACREGPHSRGKLRHHRIVPLGTVPRHASEFCEGHEDQRLDLFCTTCRCSACVMCTFGGEHKGHNVVPLVEVVATARGKLKGDVERCETLQKSIGTLSDAWAAVIPAVEERCTSVGDAVSVAFSELMTVVQQRRDELLGKVKSFQDSVQRDVTEKRAWLGALTRSAERINKSAKNLQAASPMTTLELQGLLGMNTERCIGLLHPLHGEVAEWIRRSVPDAQMLHFEGNILQQLKDEMRRAGGVTIPTVHTPAPQESPQRPAPPRTSGLSLRISTQLPAEAPAMVQAVSRRKQILQVRTEEPPLPRTSATATALNGLFRPPADSKLQLKS